MKKAESCLLSRSSSLDEVPDSSRGQAKMSATNDNSQQGKNWNRKQTHTKQNTEKRSIKAR